MTALSVRPPRQARTRAAWERVLDSGVALIEDVGYDGLTIAALCERASVTPPTIYARAGDKETLLLAIYERAMERIRASDQLPERATVREAVAAVAAVWFENAALLRGIVHRAATDPEVFRRGRENSQDLARRFRAAIGGDEHMADSVFRIVYATLVQHVMYGPQFESDLAVDDEALIEMLGDVAERYLERA